MPVLANFVPVLVPVPFLRLMRFWIVLCRSEKQPDTKEQEGPELHELTRPVAEAVDRRNPLETQDVTAAIKVTTSKLPKFP